MCYNSKVKLKKVSNKIVKLNFFLLADKGSGFDSYVVVNKLPQKRTIVV